MNVEEIIKELQEMACYCKPGVPLGQALREAIAKLRDNQALQSGDTSARLAAIKDIPTERVIALAQAERDRRMVVLPPAKGCPTGRRGRPAVCPRCGSTHVTWFGKFDLSVCRICGWNDEGEAADHLVRLILTREIDLPGILKAAETKEGEQV